MTTNETDPLARLDKLQRLLAENQRQPLKDAAGIIIPQGVDAHHRAIGKRQVIEAIQEEESRPPAARKIHEV